MQSSPAIPILSGGAPVFGHAAQMQKDTLGVFERGLAEHGDVYAITLPGRRFIVMNAPDAVRDVLVDKADAFEKGLFSAVVEPLVGLGLLTAENASHRRQRKLVAPAFHHNRVISYLDVMHRYAEQTVCSWKDGGIVDLNAEMMRLTLRIVAKTLFDADVDGDAKAVGVALSHALEFIVRRQRSTIRPPLVWPLPAHTRFRESVQQLDEILQRIINERRGSDADHGDLLSMLLASRDEGDRLTDAQVRDEAMTLFLAGHETTANALTWAMVLLAKNPQAWLKLREEVVSVLGDRAPTYADLAQLPYTLQIFKETLRLYPPAYVYGRQATRDVEINGCPIKASDVVVICAYTVHRNPAVWDEPLRFIPERFSAEREAARHKFAYVPFGGGARTCLGNQFALMEGQIVLATIAQHVKFELIHEHIVPDPQITLRPLTSVTAKIRRL